MKPRELSEIITHLAFYLGWGNAFRAVGAAKVVFAARGIRIDAVCPGTIETPMVAEMLAKQPEAVKEILRDQSIGRLGQAHLQAPHFKQYKADTLHMVKSLELVEVEPVFLGAKTR